MNSESLDCLVCFNPFDNQKQTPRVLSCGHTICAECLCRILKSSSPKCPIDNLNLKAKRIKSYKKNYILMDDSKNKVKKCPEHCLVLNYTCLQDSVKICSECALNGEHKSHEVKLTTKLKSELEEKSKELSKLSKNLSVNKKRQLESLEMKEQEIIQQLRQDYSGLKETLGEMQLEMIQGTKIFLNLEKKAIFLGAKNEGNIQDEISKRVTEIEEFGRSEDYFPIKDRDFSSFIAKSEFDLEKTEKSREVRVDQLAEYLKIEAIKQKLKLAQLNTFSRNFERGLWNNLKTEKVISESFPSTEVFSFKGRQVKYHMKLLQEGDIIYISFHQDRDNGLKANQIDWEEVKALIFECSEESILSEEDLVSISSYLQSSSLFSFDIRFKPDAPDHATQQENLEILFQSIPKLFKRRISLDTLGIDLKDCKADETSLANFFQEIFSVAYDVERMEINLSDTLLTDTGFESLFKTIELFIREVMPGNGVGRLMELDLNLSSTQITDKSLEFFADTIKRNQNTFALLSLNFQNTSIADKGVCCLMRSFDDGVKYFSLNLMQTEVSDIGALEIHEKIRERKPSFGFSSFVQLKETKISEKLQYEIEMMHSLSFPGTPAYSDSDSIRDWERSFS